MSAFNREYRVDKKITFIAIHHVSVIVENLDKSLHFYCDVLGLALDQNRPDLSFDGAWLQINPQQQIHLLVVDNPDSTIQRPEHGGRDRHTAFKVSDITVIQSALDKHQIMYTKSQSGRPALFCRDPDGNTLEIME